MSLGRGGIHRVGAKVNARWLDLLFNLAMRCPWVLPRIKRFFLFSAWRVAPILRDGPMANARWLLGPDSTTAMREAFAKRVLSSFWNFVYDVGRCANAPVDRWTDWVTDVSGVEHYEAARDMGRGVILVTAHLGSFELATASLNEIESQPILVVFQRDRAGAFERLRSKLRSDLGVEEAPIEDGFATWAAVRDALQAKRVVLMQGDRTMPGQHGVAMPVLGGHLKLPIGPIKLAAFTGAPVLPVFCIRQPDDCVKVMIEPAIDVTNSSPRVDAQHPGMQQLAHVMTTYLKQYPDQWLALQRAWLEDQQTTP